MLLKGAYCVGEHFVDPQSIIKRQNHHLKIDNSRSHFGPDLGPNCLQILSAAACTDREGGGGKGTGPPLLEKSQKCRVS